MKIYVTSGGVEIVVSSEDVEGAALWVVNEVLSPIVGASPVRDSKEQIELALIAFDKVMMCSEIGFGKGELARFDTDDVVSNWIELAEAIDKMEGI